MNQDIQTVKDYYDENAQMEWERLEQHPFEFIFTRHMLEKYIRPGDRVLDIGGGRRASGKETESGFCH